MTRRQDLERQCHSLNEIREIMNSMKMLAYMETRKLDRFLTAQHAVVSCIEDVAADFLSFHPEVLPGASETMCVYLLIGTERGFCGDFNQSLLRHLTSALDTKASGKPLLITVGHKLHTLLENDARLAAQIDGASVVEEVAVVLSQITQELASLQKTHGVLSAYVIYHGREGGIVMQKLLPPFEHYLHRPQQHLHPPILNLQPEKFLIELSEQYLFAVLHEVLYTSLMAENHNRVTHLEGAVQHLDDESDKLKRRRNALRQEEIIEEIEVILLSASSIDDGRSPH